MGSASSQHYRLVFEGAIAKGYDLDTVKRNLAALFQTDMLVIGQLFSGSPVLLKDDLDAEQAVLYLSALSQAGAVCRMESMPAMAEEQPEGFVERRQTASRRRQVDRRARLRYESLLPDRRVHADRRRPHGTPAKP